MKFLMTIIALSCSSSVLATTIELPAKPVIGINGSEVAKRVCYYQDQAYSQGAILQVGEHYLICQAENDFETNGSLSWRALIPAVPKEQSTGQEATNTFKLP